MYNNTHKKPTGWTCVCCKKVLNFKRDRCRVFFDFKTTNVLLGMENGCEELYVSAIKTYTSSQDVRDMVQATIFTKPRSKCNSTIRVSYLEMPGDDNVYISFIYEGMTLSQFLLALTKWTLFTCKLSVNDCDWNISRSGKDKLTIHAEDYGQIETFYCDILPVKWTCSRECRKAMSTVPKKEPKITTGIYH